MISLEQLKRIMPYAGPHAGVFLVPINDAMDEWGIDTPARQAAFLAQVAHESGALHYTEELASGNAYTGRTDLGNTRPEAIRIAAQHRSTPGPWWRGHGLIQITGFDNHRLCSVALYGDESVLLHEPRRLCQPVDAARSAGWFWSVHKISQYADMGDIDGVSDAVNLGRKTAGIGDSNGYQDRLAYFKRATEVLS